MSIISCHMNQCSQTVALARVSILESIVQLLSQKMRFSLRLLGTRFCLLFKVSHLERIWFYSTVFKYLFKKLVLKRSYYFLYLNEVNRARKPSSILWEEKTDIIPPLEFRLQRVASYDVKLWCTARCVKRNIHFGSGCSLILLMLKLMEQNDFIYFQSS